MIVTLPKLTTYQKDVWDFLCDKAEDVPSHYSGKVAVIKSVRQSGKSFLAQMLLIAFALTKKTTSAIYEPTLAQARVQFKAIENYFKGSYIISKANATLLEIEFSNGSVIYFKSTEQSSRGFTIDGILILDECAYLSEDEIYATLPLINAHNAPLLIASTPFISDGYYYKMFQKGIMDPTDKIKSFDWSKEKEIDRFLTPERKEFYRQTMSRSKYITEVLGEFLSDDGMLFRNIEACCTDERPEVSGKLYIGVDWSSGTENDYTVVAVVNGNGEQCGLYVTNNLTPMAQIEWVANIIKDLATKATIAKLTCEANSIGAVYIDALKQKIGGKIKITEFVTTNKSKQDLVTTLQLALENKDIALLRDNEQLNQLRSYEAQINPRTKTISYNGKAGVHDDIVIALMLAYYSYKQRLGTYSITFK